MTVQSVPLGMVAETNSAYKGKGKAIPVQAWTDHDGSRRLGLPDFKTVGT